MFPLLPLCKPPHQRFPRIRGDVPCLDTLSTASTKFSPHTRGCSLHQSGRQVCHCRFPRIRGDVPRKEVTMRVIELFSPHTRGCSQLLVERLGGGLVFPAYAGMFRPWPTQPLSPKGFPRIRGDIPWRRHRRCWRARFSPHTRGCSPCLIWNN